MHNKLFQLLSTLALTVGLFSATADAALVGRDLDGNLATAEAYYDTVANLTWLADANYAQTSSYDADGLMNWADANTWARGLTVGGVSDWRLANTVQPDDTCYSQSGGASSGINCIGSEMGNLFYNVLGGYAGTSIATIHNTNYDLFSNIQSSPSRLYWSASEYAPNSITAWYFVMGNGGQNYNISKTYGLYAWAVQSGDVGASVVPIPAAVWLFGSGLIGLIGVARRRKR